jgi:hypothetical protein
VTISVSSKKRQCLWPSFCWKWIYLSSTFSASSQLHSGNELLNFSPSMLFDALQFSCLIGIPSIINDDIHPITSSFSSTHSLYSFAIISRLQAHNILLTFSYVFVSILPVDHRALNNSSRSSLQIFRAKAQSSRDCFRPQ